MSSPEDWINIALYNNGPLLTFPHRMQNSDIVKINTANLHCEETRYKNGAYETKCTLGDFVCAVQACIITRSLHHNCTVLKD